VANINGIVAVGGLPSSAALAEEAGGDPSLLNLAQQAAAVEQSGSGAVQRQPRLLLCHGVFAACCIVVNATECSAILSDVEEE